MNNDLLSINIKALERFKTLCSDLIKSHNKIKQYKTLKSSSGHIVPVYVDNDRALHSLNDPRREAKRLTDTLNDEGFVVILGLGGGYLLEAALDREETSFVLVIDFNIKSIKELLGLIDYSKSFNDPRFYILIDSDYQFIEQFILDNYKPALYGSLATIPLRTRTNTDTEKFNNTVVTMENAIKKVSRDYSVQAHFGTVWFSNIIRNIIKVEPVYDPVPAIKHAAITAAGPSLDIHIKEIKKRRNDFFLISTDTSLPCLLFEKIYPDAVVSIDCQHVSYHHFFTGIPDGTLLFLDLASPPIVACQAAKPLFFSGSHPLTAYISLHWCSLPHIDTSGGNITYTAVALAEKMGAEKIEMFGTDYSYPFGQTYAKGSYVYPYFEKKQKRLDTLEGLSSTFLYRTPLSKKFNDKNWYYENASLSFYREQLEQKSIHADFELIHRQGSGAPIKLLSQTSKIKKSNLFTYGKYLINAEDFLSEYMNNIISLPLSEPYNEKHINIFTTLLPAAAALRHRDPHLNKKDLLEKTKNYCIEKIKKTLANYKNNMEA